MLSRAVDKHQGNAQSRSNPPGWSQKKLAPSGPQQSALQQSSFSSLNASAALNHPSANLGLKRTPNQNSNTAARSYSTSNTMAAAPEGKGVLDQLHSNVYFDENDFVDDSELGLDDDSPIQLKLSQPNNRAFSRPQVPDPTKNTSLTNFNTSQIPWSSSPLNHKGTPPNAHMINRNPSTTIDLTKEDSTSPPRKRKDSPISHEPPKPKKRSALPWLDPSKPVVTDPRANAEAARIAEAVAQVQKTRPAPRKTESGPAWTSTANAVKEQQKKHRRAKAASKQAQKVVPAGKDATGAARAASKNKQPAQVFLSDEQKKVINIVVEKGQSVFFTGSAGTGKSVLMREIITRMKQKHAKEPDRVAVTASTGLAACNIGGVSLHSFAGIGLGKEPVEQLVKKVKKNAKTKTRWLRTKVLVVDEISMVDGDLFDKLEALARQIRGNGRPFGGIQLVVTGDFFQLPPVPENSRAAKFAFDASTWPTVVSHTIGLTHVYRQKDAEFASMLNEMRLGKLSASAIASFKSLGRPLQGDVIDATELFPTRNEVANANGNRMRNLPGDTLTFVAQDGGSITDAEFRTRLLSNCMAEQTLILKKGAQVMLIKNIDDTLVNGSIGKIIAFMDEKSYDIYNESDEVLGSQAQDQDDTDGNGIQKGRAQLRNMINKDPTASTGRKWPLVRFKLADGSSRHLLCTQEVWKIELPNGEVQASRAQVPLILAWALSIHKAQGQTLERVKVNLAKVFENGQAYVALSRATSREGLQILDFNPDKVRAHPRVKSFYDSLYGVEKATEAAVTKAQPKDPFGDMFDDDNGADVMESYGM